MARPIVDRYKSNPAKEHDKILEEYNAYLADVESVLSFKGKTLGQANSEHASNYIRYAEKKVELDVLVKWLDVQRERVRGELYKRYTEGASREFNDRTKERYIDHEATFIHANQLYLEMLEMAEKYAQVVRAFETRAYQLRNLTELRINQLHDAYII